ncbi:hypothetical protein Tco_1134517 [Tanacetum coccineum]
MSTCEIHLDFSFPRSAFPIEENYQTPYRHLDVPTTSRSRLFEVYASELLSQFKGKTANIRCCSCIDDNKEHTELVTNGNVSSRKTRARASTTEFEEEMKQDDEYYEILSHFYSGIVGCTNSPDGLWCSALTLAHVKHLLT